MPRLQPVPRGELAALAGDLGFSLTPEAVAGLSVYLGMLMQWNRAMNLVGTGGWRETFLTLVADSLHLAGFLDRLDLPAWPRCWDLGAGAGLPGIPLRCVWQKGDYWLVDSREKRTLFLSAVLARHPLPGTRVFRGRVEKFLAGPPPRCADLIVSRAFMPPEQVLALVRSHLTREGLALLLLHALPPKAFPGWKLMAHHEYSVEQAPRCFAALRPESE